MRALALLSLLLLPATSFALELDFYTYNAFEETVDAFHRLGLIVSDNGFLVFVLVFTALGVTFGALKAGMDGLSGSQINPVAWAIPTVVGVAVFKGLVLSTGTMHVYDPVRNAYEPVPGVPDAIVILAGTLSKIERGMVEITDTASANPFADRAGGINYSLIKSAMDADLNDRYLEKSVVEYYNYCGTRAIGQSTTGNMGQDLMHNSEDLATDFGKWTNNVLTVVYYPAGNDQGVTLTCKEAWDAMNARMSNISTFDPYIDSICRQVGMNPLDGAQRGRCMSLMTDNATLFGVSSPSLIAYLRSIILAKGVSDATRSEDFSQGQRMQVDRQVMAEGFGTAEAMNSWIPRLRAYMMAMVLGIIPMALLFLVTPLFRSAMALMLGLFAWLALWGTCDAVSTQMAFDAAQDAFDQIREQKLGVEAILQSPEAAVQALGIFGKARMVALTLATALSAALFKFGGYAFAQLGQQWQGHLEQAGEAAGRNTMLPESQAAFQRSLIASGGPQAALAAYGFNNAAAGAAGQDMSTAAYGGAYVDNAVAGMSLSRYSSETADRTTQQTTGANLGAIRYEQSTYGGGTVASSSAASTEGELARNQKEGELATSEYGSVSGAAQYSAAGSHASKVTMDRKIEEQTGSAAVTAASVKEVAYVDAANDIARQQLLNPDSAMDNATTRITEDVAYTREAGMPGAAIIGKGRAIDSEAGSQAAINVRSALGEQALVSASEGGRIASVAASENQHSFSELLGGNGSMAARVEAEQSRGSNANFLVPESQKAAFLESRTDLGAEQRTALMQQPGALLVSGGFDPNDPTSGIQIGSFSALNTASAGNNTTIHDNTGQMDSGWSRTYNDAVRLADPNALTHHDSGTAILKDMLFDDGAKAGRLTEMEELTLANSWASVINNRGTSATSSDTDSVSSTFGGGGHARAGSAFRGGASADVNGAVHYGNTGQSLVSENVGVTTMREYVSAALSDAQTGARRMFGDEQAWDADQSRLAQTYIAERMQNDLYSRASALTSGMSDETQTRSNMLKDDLENAESNIGSSQRFAEKGVEAIERGWDATTKYIDGLVGK